MKTVTEFNTSVAVVTKVITYKFFRGVLHRIHDGDGAFYLVILAFGKLWLFFTSSR